MLRPDASAAPVSVTIKDLPDVVMARSEVKLLARAIGFDSVDQSRIATAVHELAVNILHHAVEGVMHATPIEHNANRGIEIVFQDRGPGIADVEAARQGCSPTNGGRGMGLSTTRLLVDEMEISSNSNDGTRIVIRKCVRSAGTL